MNDAFKASGIFEYQRNPDFETTGTLFCDESLHVRARMSASIVRSYYCGDTCFEPQQTEATNSTRYTRIRSQCLGMAHLGKAIVLYRTVCMRVYWV